MAEPSRIGRPAGAHNVDRTWFGLPTDWMNRRACTWDDRHLFFSENDSSRLKARFAEMEAKAICATCPVQGECLDYAIAGDMHGIWGGLTRQERDKAKKRRGRARVRVDPPSTR